MTTTGIDGAETAIADVFRGAGGHGFVHARSVDEPAPGAEVAVGADHPVVSASVFKVAVMLEVANQAVTGELALTDRVRVPASRRTIGPTGLSVMLDDVDISVRDLAYWMMSVSDNTATDVLMEMVGVDRIAATLHGLGLNATSVPETCAQLLAGLVADLGLDPDDPSPTFDLRALDADVVAGCRALAAAETNRTTPREMTTLLSLIWTDAAGPAEACAEVRRIMAAQVWPHRLRSGFPDGVAVAAKTGTLPGIRNEAGVITFPDGGRFAVAVFTRADAYDYQQPAMDAAIGQAARIAVNALRDDAP